MDAMLHDLPSGQPRRPTLTGRLLRRTLLSAMLASAWLSIPSAHAAITRVTYATHTDGTAGFDGIDGPGLDSGPNNDIVRTNDIFEYQVTLSTNSLEKRPYIRLTMPPTAHGTVRRWSFVPANCVQGASTLSPDGQTLTCVLPDMAANATSMVYFRGEVLGNAHNGMTLPTPTIEVGSASSPAVGAQRVPADLKVSAAPFYDVAVTIIRQGSWALSDASGPNGEDGFFLRYAVGLIARNPHGTAALPHGKKGVEQLNPNVPVTIDLDLSRFPGSVKVDNWRPPASNMGSYADGCGSIHFDSANAWANAPHNLSGSRIATFGQVQDKGPMNSRRALDVANGGDCNTLFSDRNTMRIALQGVDTTLTHVPTDITPTTFRIPPGEYWVANKGVILWTNISDYPENKTVSNPLAFRQVSGESISGQPLNSDSNPNNNEANYQITRSYAGVSSKSYHPDYSLLAPYRTERDSTVLSGNVVNQMVPGQTVTGRVGVRNSGLFTLHDVMACEVIDRTAFDIRENFSVSIETNLTGSVVEYGAHANGSPYFASTDTAPSEYEGNTLAMQSVAGNSAYSRATCDDSNTNIRWFSSREEAEANGGLVYVRVKQATVPAGESIAARVNGLILRKTWANTIVVENPNSPEDAVRRAGATIPDGTIIRNRADIVAYTGNAAGTGPDTILRGIRDARPNRDHLRVISRQVVSRVSQTILEPNIGVNNIPVPAGALLTYELQPRQATTMPPSPGKVTVVNVLPPSLRYQPGSSTVGGVGNEPTVETNLPQPGYTRLTWVFDNHTPHLGQISADAAKLSPIRFKARLAFDLSDGTTVTNETHISGDDTGADGKTQRHDVEPDCSYNSGFGNTCTKSASTKVVLQSPGAFRMEKQASKDSIEPGETVDFTVTFLSLGQPIPAVDMPDIIDILPFNGDGNVDRSKAQNGRSPASAFDAGAWQLLGVTPPAADPNARIYYTSLDPSQIHNDPRHASNQIPGGSTRWCLQAELGSAGCPATLAQTTAVRVSPSGISLPPGVAYDVTMKIGTDPLVARPGNILANRAGLRPVAPGSTLHFVESPSDLHVKIHSPMGEISGRVFVDINQNNVQDPEDWAQGRQCVILHGTALRGHAVTVSTLTDDSDANRGHFHFVEGRQDAIYRGDSCSGTPLKNFGGVPPGTYTLSRQAPEAGITPAAVWAASNSGTVEGQEIREIKVTGGFVSADNHFTSTPVPPQLTLASRVENTWGGKKTAADFTLSATHETRNDVITGTHGSTEVSGISVQPGVHVLIATPLPGYAAGTWQCSVNGAADVPGDKLTLTWNDKAICRVHFNDQPARLTLQKKLVFQHGRDGQATETDFTLSATVSGEKDAKVEGKTGTPDVTNREIAAGSYRLAEAHLPGFKPASPWVCERQQTDGTTTAADMDADNPDIVMLDNGAHVICTINNTDAPLMVSLTRVETNGDTSVATARNDEIYVERVSSGERIPLKLHESASNELVPGEKYKFSAKPKPGHTTDLRCTDAGNLQSIPLELELDSQIISCAVTYKRIPTTASVTKVVESQPALIPGTGNEYLIGYQVTVEHGDGADGHYDLSDTPAFDPDVEVLSVSATLNGAALPPMTPTNGTWTLASARALNMGETHDYRLSYRIRVPFGSNTANDQCRNGALGHGLLNHVQMTPRNDLDDAQISPSANLNHLAQACADTPEPLESSTLSIEKTSNMRSAEVGDFITYRVRVRNNGNGPARNPVLVDRLPAGFRLERASVRVQNASATRVEVVGNRELRIKLDRISSPNAGGADSGEALITYRVRLGVGSQEGDGINRAHMMCPTLNRRALTQCSNESRWKIEVRAGIFTEEACVAGQVFVDCNGNSIKDHEELGIPGVRMYLQNGTWMVSDEEGKYSHCGLRPRTHVLKVDEHTLPRRSRLVTSSAQNVGDAHSLFIDAKKGMLHRADFIEGSCSNTVIEQVKARKRQGANHSVQTEGSLPVLSFESKRESNALPHQQGTDRVQMQGNMTRH
ncbi:MAG: hypothetical protein Q4D19_08005 [Lautropia sp.]|nr:hypothetical protein [Lautropia sp.]